MEYSNELVQEGIGKLVYDRGMGAGEGPDQEQLPRTDRRSEQGVPRPLADGHLASPLGRLRRGRRPLRMPRDAPPEQETRGYFVPWSAIFYL